MDLGRAPRKEEVRMSNQPKPVAWACRTCGKLDWADTDEMLAAPEHLSHRGIDIGTCKGEMIRLYTKEPNHE